MADEPITHSGLASNDGAAGFTLKSWHVHVDGYGAATYDTPTRGKALAQAWRSDAFSSVTFGEFMRMARCRRCHDTPARWGDPITVDGEPAFYVGGTRASVTFVRPGEDVVMTAHPYDVLPVEYRPEQYQPAPIARLQGEAA